MQKKKGGLPLVSGSRSQVLFVMSIRLHRLLGELSLVLRSQSRAFWKRTHGQNFGLVPAPKKCQDILNLFLVKFLLLRNVTCSFFYWLLVHQFMKISSSKIVCRFPSLGLFIGGEINCRVYSCTRIDKDFFFFMKVVPFNRRLNSTTQ